MSNQPIIQNIINLNNLLKEFLINYNKIKKENKIEL